MAFSRMAVNGEMYSQLGRERISGQWNLTSTGRKMREGGAGEGLRAAAWKDTVLPPGTNHCRLFNSIRHSSGLYLAMYSSPHRQLHSVLHSVWIMS